MGGLMLGLVLGVLAFIPPLRKWVSIPALVFGGVGGVSLLVIMGGSRSLGSSPYAMFSLLQLAAAGAMFSGAIGMRSGAPWAAPLLFGAAAGWLVGNATFLRILMFPQLLMTSTGVTYGALALGVPVLAVCAGLCCSGEREGARV